MKTRDNDSTTSMVATTSEEFPTTAGVLAMQNLQAQLDGQERQAAAGRLTVRGQGERIALIALRGHLLGCIKDAEQAEELAEQLVYDAPTEGLVFFARARTRAAFHRFAEALDDLDEAERLGIARVEIDGERADIFQAVGRYEDAFAIRNAAVEVRRDFESAGALALLYAEKGETAAAEAQFDSSRALYRSVSPFALAMLDFQRGRMWLEREDFHRARFWFRAACRRLPAYAPAQGHLAEVEAAMGEHESALARLAPVTVSSDDPDYAAQFGRILAESNRTEEARTWLARAAAVYDALVARHPAAYADHAAEFWLTTGTDPEKALCFACTNVSVRRTPRARELVTRAAEEFLRCRSGASPGRRYQNGDGK